jgi:DNA-binding NtrC family response regulator
LNGDGSPHVEESVSEILVVDDDTLIRSLVADWLTEAGHQVRQARNGDDALVALRAAPAELLITDMHMPERDGVQTLAALRREFPALPVIAMSGHFSAGKEYSPQQALQEGACRVLAKPFARDVLLEAVREVVGTE